MKAGKSHDAYWPGFVDALTNVVIALVFVVLILVLSLSFSAQLMAKRMAQRLFEEQKSAVNLVTEQDRQSDEAARCKIAQNEPPRDAVRDGVSQPVVSESEPRPQRLSFTVRGTSAGASASSSIAARGYQIDVRFLGSALELDTATERDFTNALRSLVTDRARADIVLVMRTAQADTVQRRQSSYLRLMSVRNSLLDSGFSASRIDMRSESGDASQVGVVTVEVKP